MKNPQLNPSELIAGSMNFISQSTNKLEDKITDLQNKLDRAKTILGQCSLFSKTALDFVKELNKEEEK